MQHKTLIPKDLDQRGPREIAALDLRYISACLLCGAWLGAFGKHSLLLTHQP